MFKLGSILFAALFATVLTCGASTQAAERQSKILFVECVVPESKSSGPVWKIDRIDLNNWYLVLRDDYKGIALLPLLTVLTDLRFDTEYHDTVVVTLTEVGNPGQCIPAKQNNK